MIKIRAADLRKLMMTRLPFQSDSLTPTRKAQFLSQGSFQPMTHRTPRELLPLSASKLSNSLSIVKTPTSALKCKFTCFITLQ